MQSDPVEIISYRAGDGNMVKIEYHKRLPSTASLAREYAIAGKPDRFVVFAEEQPIYSHSGTKLTDNAVEKGVFLSLILRPSIFPSQAGLIGPLATVALLGAFEEHTTTTAGIGWVTDIIYDGKKIGWCTVEGKLNDFSSYEYMIVSFALKIDDRTFAPRLTDMIRKVFDDESPSVPMLIARTVLNKFFTVYADIKNPSKHMNIYKQKFAYYDKKIIFLKDGKKTAGKIIDVDKKSCVLTVSDRKGETFTVTSPTGIIFPQEIKIFSTFKNNNRK